MRMSSDVEAMKVVTEAGTAYLPSESTRNDGVAKGARDVIGISYVNRLIPVGLALTCRV